MKKKIYAEDFFCKWLLFSNEKITNTSDWIKAWDLSRTWSNLILGTKKSSEIGSPIGKFFEEQYGKNLRHRTEDGLYDLSFTLNNNISFSESLKKIRGWKTMLDNTEKVFYPSIYDVLFEHENDIYDSWQEVAKLAYVRSPLKILVTYHTDNKRNVLNEKTMMIKTFEEIVSQCCDGFSDNIQTEYLLILGEKKENKLEWTGIVFDSVGKKIKELYSGLL